MVIGRRLRLLATTCALGLAFAAWPSYGQENAGDTQLTTETSQDARDARAPRDPRPPRPPRDPDQVFELEDASIQEIIKAMNSNGLTSVELVDMYLRRIQAYNYASPIAPPQPLNAIIALSPTLLDDAAESDRLRKRGIALGPLQGIPFLVKGSYSIRNMALTGGHNGWKDNITLNDAFVVKTMRQAGGIVMGHANMDTWASSAVSSTSQIAGTVRSCYLTGAFPGGSSGGSGVASGAWLTQFAFGGETGGSIRDPSDRNDLVGFKVSGGSISVDKVIPLVPEHDVIGPMTRKAIDNAYIRDVVGKHDPGDIWAPILPILEDKRPVPQTGFMEALKTATLAGKHIGIIGTYVGQPNPNPGEGATSNTTQVQNTTDATKALMEAAKAEMEAAGATVDYVFLDAPVSTTYNRGPDAPALVLNSSPSSNNVAAYSYRSLIESVVYRPGDDYQTLAAKVLYTASLVGNNISTTRRAAMYSIDPDTGLYGEGTLIPFGSPEGIEHYTARRDQKDAFEAWMDANGLDVVVWPMWPNKGPTSGTIVGRDLVNNMLLPGVTVPMGVLQYDETRSEPLTMDITGRLYDDPNVLAVAYAYEQATHHRYLAPLAPPLEGETFEWKVRRLKKWAVEDTDPPALTVLKKVKGVKKGVVSFDGAVKDKSGIDRIEVSVGGLLIPAVVTGKDWTAVLPPEAYSYLMSTGATSVEVLVMAVDVAGNTAAEDAVVKL
jgi:amidase